MIKIPATSIKLHKNMRLILEPWYSDNHQVAIIILAESDSTQTHFF